MTKEQAYEQYIKPAKIFGNLYFIGIRAVCTHLIDTGAGLIIIDPGYSESLEIIIKNVEELGFNIKDIKYIVISHAHYDHMDSVAELISITGAKTFIGKADLPLLENKFFHYPLKSFVPDVLISDGDVISLGNTEILCLETPGHTEGTISFFFNVTDGEKTYRAGMFGGAGLNTLHREFMLENGIPFEMRDKYFASLKKIRTEKVEIFLGNHLGNNRTEEKLALLGKCDENPFVKNSQEEWVDFLDKKRRELENLIASEA